jgi:hypothetical protein
MVTRACSQSLCNTNSHTPARPLQTIHSCSKRPTTHLREAALLHLLRVPPRKTISCRASTVSIGLLPQPPSPRPRQAEAPRLLPKRRLSNLAIFPVVALKLATPLRASRGQPLSPACKRSKRRAQRPPSGWLNMETSRLNLNDRGLPPRHLARHRLGPQPSTRG